MSITADQRARALAEYVARSRNHMVEIISDDVEGLPGQIIGTQWVVRIIGRRPLWDRGGQVFWFQPAKGRPYLSGAYLDRYGNHKKHINVGKYDYRKLNLWLAVCVEPYIPEEER